MDSKYFLLNNGEKIPQIGLGTWLAENEAELETAIDAALETGYRHIDTATAYRNEHVIGRVLRKWFDSGKLKREDIFITTKLPPWGMKPSNVLKYLRKSLVLLQLDYLDLYLIHVPFAFSENEREFIFATNKDGKIVYDNNVSHKDIWREMEKAVTLKLTKSIGLSNFNMKQIREILKHSQVPPSNLQIELNAYLQQEQLIKFCREKQIVITADSPFGIQGVRHNEANLPNILSHPVVKKIAEKHNRTNGQILLKHILQKNIVAIPKSLLPSRIKDNLDIFNFELEKCDIKELNRLDRGIRILDFEFLFPGIKSHPEYPFTELVRNKK